MPRELLRPHTVVEGVISRQKGNWRYAAENGIDEGHVRYLHRRGFYTFFREIPAWTTLRMGPSADGEWLTRIVENVVWSDEYPELGRWPRSVPFWESRARGALEIGIRLPCWLRIQQHGWTSFEMYVPSDANHYLSGLLLCGQAQGLAAARFHAKYFLWYRWAYHGLFHNADQWIIEQMEIPRSGCSAPTPRSRPGASSATTTAAASRSQPRRPRAAGAASQSAWAVPSRDEASEGKRKRWPPVSRSARSPGAKPWARPWRRWSTVLLLFTSPGSGRFFRALVLLDRFPPFVHLTPAVRALPAPPEKLVQILWHTNTGHLLAALGTAHRVQVDSPLMAFADHDFAPSARFAQAPPTVYVAPSVASSQSKMRWARRPGVLGSQCRSAPSAAVKRDERFRARKRVVELLGLARPKFSIIGVGDQHRAADAVDYARQTVGSRRRKRVEIGGEPVRPHPKGPDGREGGVLPRRLRQGLVEGRLFSGVEQLDHGWR